MAYEIITYINEPLWVNNYLLIDLESKDALLFDIGQDVEGILHEINLRKFNLCGCMLTHGHFDHALGLLQWNNFFPNIPVFVPKKDNLFLDTIVESARSFGITATKAPLPDIIWIDDEYIFPFKNFSLQILSTPGHTPGSLCFLQDTFLFSGDTLFYESVGRWDLPQGNQNQLLTSVKWLSERLDNEVQVFPGHGQSTTIKHEKHYNPFL